MDSDEAATCFIASYGGRATRLSRVRECNIISSGDFARCNLFLRWKKVVAMYNSKRIIALVPARGGSKGIKRKNVMALGGRPLISYTIEAALASKYIDTVIVSTDDREIANVARGLGALVPFYRPADLATDEAPTIGVVLHAMEYLESIGDVYETLVLLQPTQPLRATADIDEALEFHFANDERSLVSVSLVDDHPLLIRTIDGNNSAVRLIDANSTCRRQDMPTFYKVNGCIYINNVNELSSRTSFNDNDLAFVMDPNHSVDIDEIKDAFIAEYYLNNL